LTIKRKEGLVGYRKTGARDMRGRHAEELNLSEMVLEILDVVSVNEFMDLYRDA